MTDPCSPGSHPHSDRPNWQPAESVDEYMANCREGLETYSERRFCKLVGWSRAQSWRAKMLATIPEELFEMLVTGRKTSTRELAIVGSLFVGDGHTRGVEVDRCPHCQGVLRVRTGISKDTNRVIDAWLAGRSIQS